MPRKCQKQILFNNSPQVSFPITEEAEAKPLLIYPYSLLKVQKPRRNKSAFLLFSSEKRALLKASSENLNSNQMMAKLAELWNNISPEERRRYDMEAIEEKKRYLQELELFKKGNPFAGEVHNKTKKNHIKKPCSAYGIFVKEATVEIKKENPGLLMADVLKIVSQRWKNLSEDEKLQYQEKALQEKYIAREKLEQIMLEEQNALSAESPVKQRKTKQLGETRKQIKKDANCFSEATQDTFSVIPFDLCFDQQAFTEEVYVPEENFDFNNFECPTNFFVPSVSFYAEPEPKTAQVIETQPSLTSIPSIQECRLPSTFNFAMEDLTASNTECTEVQNVLERFSSSMFNSEPDSLKHDAFELVDRIPSEMPSNSFSSYNDLEDFSLSATCSLPSRQQTLSSILLRVLE